MWFPFDELEQVSEKDVYLIVLEGVLKQHKNDLSVFHLLILQSERYTQQEKECIE